MEEIIEVERRTHRGEKTKSVHNYMEEVQKSYGRDTKNLTVLSEAALSELKAHSGEKCDQCDIASSRAGNLRRRKTDDASNRKVYTTELYGSNTKSFSEQKV